MKLARKINNFQLKLELCLVILFLILQIVFWKNTESIKPNLGIVPDVPTLSTIKAFSFGDEEFYFRYKGLRIQNTGDTYGRFSPLKNYDYKKLSEWFYALDNLDNKSNYIPSLAAYYYSMTQNTDDVLYIINYLEHHADSDPEKKWWWYYQAMSLAKYTYKDNELAIKLATKLRDLSPANAPIWTKQMLAFLLANKGENCEALKIISEILNDFENSQKDSDNKPKLSDEELNFMKFFIQNKINELKQQNFDPRKCI